MMKLVDKMAYPIAIKKSCIWEIDGTEYNFRMPLDRFGATYGEVYLPKRYEVIARYPSGKNWLIGVFLECAHTA